jgi:hypothetical protein
MKKVCKLIGLILFPALLTWLPSGAVASVGKLPEYDWGFIVSKDTTAEGADRMRIAGPLFERQSSTNKVRFLAARPFYSRSEDPARGRILSEFLWPVAMNKEGDGEDFWRVLCAFGLDSAPAKQDQRNHVAVIPFLYTGRDMNGGRYFAVFPIGGTISELFFVDKIMFVLWPLYCHSSVRDVHTYDILWPFISWTSGPDKHKFRILPFYAKSVSEGKWEKTFIMWPLWTSAQYTYPDNKGYGFILFPLFGHMNLEDQQSWLVLPPFFRWSKSKELTALNCPWPFVEYSSGLVDKLYLWPVWGKRTMKGTKSWFAAASMIWGDEIDRVDHITKHFMIFPLFFSESKTRKPGVDAGNNGKAEPALSSETSTNDPQRAVGNRPDVFERYVKLWPLMTYEREGDNVQWRALDLWPTTRMASIERNYAPFWTLYSHTRVEDRKEDEFLWGLFRWQRGGGVKYVSLFPLFSAGSTGDVNDGSYEWSFLKGLIGYDRQGLRKTYRLLYFMKF